MVNRTEAFKRWPSFLTFIILLLKFDIGVDCFAHLKSSDHRQQYSKQSLDPIHHNDKNCYYRSDILICSASLDNKESPQKLSNSAAVSSILEDPYNSFPLFDKILFKLFSASVTAEMQKSSDKEPKNYGELMDLINEMTKTRSVQRVNDQGKNMLKRLFPPWLLTQYKWMFAAPFPEFSAWMNAYVTHWTTNWLMGNSTVYDLEFSNEAGQVVTRKAQGLLVEKCRFLESAGCARTCLHACKIPTQRFFLEEMGLPVTMLPNMTDFSCKFEFGVMPLPLEEDPVYKTPCLTACPLNLKRAECLSGNAAAKL